MPTKHSCDDWWIAHIKDSFFFLQAVCDQLEEQVYSLQRLTQEKDAKIALLEEELALHKSEIDNLRKSLR